MSASDPLEALITAAAAGSHAAFTSLVEQTIEELRCYAAVRCLDFDMVDEAVQSAYVDAYRNISSYRTGGSVIAWLKGITRHRIQRALRERARRPQTGDRVLASLTAATSSTDGDGLDTGALLRALDGCLGRLSPELAGLVRSYYHSSTPLGDLASELGRSRRGLAVTMTRIRRSLRQCLQSQGFTL